MPVSGAILWPLAALMAVATAYLLRWAAEARSTARAAVTLFLLAMMAAMFGGAAIYVAAPSVASLVLGLWVSAVLMSLSVLPLFLVILRSAARRGEGVDAPPFHPSVAFSLGVGALVLANELLMGWTFSMAAGIDFLAGSVGNLFPNLVTVVSSSWFLFTMSAEMGLATYLLRAHLDAPLRVVFGAQSVIMFLSPVALSDGRWIWWSVVLGSVAMIGLFVYQLEYIYRHREFNDALARYLVRLLALYALMMAGLFVWQSTGDSSVFAVSIVLEMVVFLDAIVHAERFRSGPSFPWQFHARWAFELLGFIFVAELFMGAVLDIQLLGSSWLALVPALPLSGGLGAVAYNAFYNGFWFVALVTGSTWFLVMMGAEMGSLVLFKLRETTSRENRVRMGLMVASYALFATFFPSSYYSALFPTAPSGTAVPVLGWSMGLGSAPIVPSLFLVILVTYLIFGSLSVLFGRRVVCSVFCTAPLMYQGTTLDAMKSFNRSSPPARKYLGSRFSTVYSTTNGITMAALVAVSFLSYFDQTGQVSLTILGADPSVFFFAFSFSVLWYALLVMVPYAGNYNCVTMGWCYTGTIAAAFQKIGFFKLKVRDRQVCWDCTTLDCAKGCPVGLVDMVGHFRQRGEFRSTKCCGVGDCVEVCPHDNLYISDVRHWIRRRLGRPETRPRRTGLGVTTAAPTAGLARAAIRTSPPFGLTSLPMASDPSRIRRA